MILLVMIDTTQYSVCLTIIQCEKQRYVNDMLRPGRPAFKELAAQINHCPHKSGHKGDFCHISCGQIYNVNLITTSAQRPLHGCRD